MFVFLLGSLLSLCFCKYLLHDTQIRYIHNLFLNAHDYHVGHFEKQKSAYYTLVELQNAHHHVCILGKHKFTTLCCASKCTSLNIQHDLHYHPIYIQVIFYTHMFPWLTFFSAHIYYYSLLHAKSNCILYIGSSQIPPRGAKLLCSFKPHPHISWLILSVRRN